MRKQRQVEPLAVSLEEAARAIGVSRRTLASYLDDPTINFPSFKFGRGRRLVPVRALRAWVERRSGGGEMRTTG